MQLNWDNLTSYSEKQAASQPCPFLPGTLSQVLETPEHLTQAQWQWCQGCALHAFAQLDCFLREESLAQCSEHVYRAIAWMACHGASDESICHCHKIWQQQCPQLAGQGCCGRCSQASASYRWRCRASRILIDESIPDLRWQLKGSSVETRQKLKSSILLGLTTHGDRGEGMGWLTALGDIQGYNQI